MQKSDVDNLDLATSQTDVDRLNSEFYGDYPYPWPTASFERLDDPLFAARMLAQDVGDYRHAALPASGARIWVAGCGTNQAIITALRFPGAAVVGSDLSKASLAMCEANAKQVGAQNLVVRRESLNDVTYEQEFDYVICTGVIHHNADPSKPLLRLAAALKPGGLMELMVYNRYHSILPTACQRAMRILAGDGGQTDFKLQLSLAKKLITERKGKGSLMSHYLESKASQPDSLVADQLIQPVWQSYTVESLGELCASCGLELVAPCISAFDQQTGRTNWDMEIRDPELRARYEALPDTARWQFTNLVMLESSPQLWFYIQRKDSPRRPQPERAICDEFLKTTFTRTGAQKEVWVRDPRDPGCVYTKGRAKVPHPQAIGPGDAKRVYDALASGRPIGETFQRLNIPTSFQKAHEMRLQLTTTAYPYLQAAG
jgi:2-polyprenyl-3-methyl-5-hydroxy-6-metoxy-1,4-benzoquinol methylase